MGENIERFNMKVIFQAFHFKFFLSTGNYNLEKENGITLPLKIICVLFSKFEYISYLIDD